MLERLGPHSGKAIAVYLGSQMSETIFIAPCTLRIPSRWQRSEHGIVAAEKSTARPRLKSGSRNPAGTPSVQRTRQTLRFVVERLLNSRNVCGNVLLAYDQCQPYRNSFAID